MPGLQLFKKGFYSHIGANQPIVAGTINLGSRKGRGSSTRVFNNCKHHSANPSECINQFITVSNSSAPITFVDLSLFLPYVVGQGNTDACQCYSSIYYIGSYYNMLIQNNLDFNTINKNSLDFESYYSNSNNIMNPLYVWTEINGSSAGPNTYEITDYYSEAQQGIKTFSNFNLPINPPSVSNNVIENYPPSIDNPIYCYPFNPNQYMNILYSRQSYTNYYNTFTLQSLINLLNQNIPIWFAVDINNYFNTTFKLSLNPAVSSYYNNSTSPVTFNSATGIWYCTSTTDPDVTDKTAGHAMILCGYINNVPFANQVDGSSGVFIIRNQYSQNFGNNGNCYITYNYFFSGLGIDINGNPTSTYNSTALSNGSSPVDMLATFPINQ